MKPIGRVDHIQVAYGTALQAHDTEKNRPQDRRIGGDSIPPNLAVAIDDTSTIDVHIMPTNLPK